MLNYEWLKYPLENTSKGNFLSIFSIFSIIISFGLAITVLYLKRRKRKKVLKRNVN